MNCRKGSIKDRLLLLRKQISADCSRYENYNGFISVLKRFFLYPAFRVLVLYRIISVIGGGYFYRLIAYRNRIDIPLKVHIGKGFCMPHNGPVVINGGAVIGEYCTMHPNSMIGGMRGDGAPVVGNYVFIGNGAKIIGNVRVADYTFIAPNAVVVKDTIEGSVVAGVPAKIINFNGRKYVEMYLS